MKAIRILFVLASIVTLNFSATAQAIDWADQVSSTRQLETAGAIASLKAGSGYNSPNSYLYTFENPRSIRQIILLRLTEISNLDNISLIDVAGKEHLLPEEDILSKEARDYSLLYEIKPTSYKVAQVKIDMAPSEHVLWREVLSIGLADFERLTDLQLKLNKLESNFPKLKHLTEIEREPVNPQINSLYPETKPLISADGQFLYFCRQNHPDNIGGKTDVQDIYYSRWINGEWSKPRNIGKPLNNAFSNGMSTLSPDGKSMLLINDFSERGTPAHGASIAHLGKNKWEAPEALQIDGYYNKSDYVDFYMSNNKQVLVMAIERKDSEGDQDLYFSTLQSNGRYSEPKNMGSVINTPGPEFAPFLAPDNRTLFFASEGLRGMGGSDIYFTVRLDDSWQNWTLPQNMGYMVNSAGYDAYFSTSLDMSEAYYISTTGPTGSKDIYKLSLGKKKPVLFELTGVVQNRFNAPVKDVRLVYKSMNSDAEGEINLNDEGKFELYLITGDNYELTFISKGYLPRKEVLDLTESNRDNQYIQVEMDAQVDEIFVDLKNVFFQTGTAKLQKSSYKQLDKLADLMRKQPSLKLHLEGHTDNTGPTDYNIKLSQQRVKTVVDYLVNNKNIEDSRFTYKGYGPIRPIASNDTPQGRKKNRRVEAVITEY